MLNRTKRGLALSLLVAVSAGLPGCATIRGGQTPLSGMTPAALISFETAGEDYAALETASERITYRDRIIRTYVAALDARFREYVLSLDREDNLSSLGSDLLRLALSTATAFVPLDDIEDLATITVAANGALSSIDRRIFRDRTMQTLIVAMQAERDSVLADINRNKLRSDYTIDDAFDDLRRLQDAGSLRAGLTRMARRMAEDQAAQAARVAAIPTACEDMTPTTELLFTEFRILVNSPATSAQRLPIAAQALGLTIAPGSVPSWADVSDAFDQQHCTDEKRRTFINALRTQIETEGGSNG
jgi:hypothetical protein